MKSHKSIHGTVEKERPSLFSFTWHVDDAGYELSDDRRSIRRRGGRLIPYRPDAIAPKLHHTFAVLANQALNEYESEADIVLEGPFEQRRFPTYEDALLAFVNNFGFLGLPSTTPGAQAHEPLDYIERQRTTLSLFFDFGVNTPGLSPMEAFNAHAPSVVMQLAPTRNGGYSLQAVPQTLIAWIWLRVGQDLANGVAWDGPPCVNCERPMPRGPGAYRVHALFCSSKCKTYFNRLPLTEKRKLRNLAQNQLQKLRERTK